MVFAGRIYVGGDGFGEKLKDPMVKHLRGRGFEVEDVGTGKYYEVSAAVARAVQGGGDAARGMLFCGTGMGVGIIANKFCGVYAATVENEAAARNSRAINNSNVLCMGGMVTAPEEATVIADAWLEQEHGKPPVKAGETAPEWWSAEVEQFLAQKWPEVKDVEADSRQDKPQGPFARNLSASLPQE